jgi:hypothetical protein
MGQLNIFVFVPFCTGKHERTTGRMHRMFYTEKAEAAEKRQEDRMLQLLAGSHPGLKRIQTRMRV